MIYNLTSSFITLPLITINVGGIVHLGVNTVRSGGTEARSLWKNFRNILDLSPSRHSNLCIYVASEKSYMRSTMEWKVSFHLSIYVSFFSQPRSGRGDYNLLPLIDIEGCLRWEGRYGIFRWSGYRSSGVWRTTLTNA